MSTITSQNRPSPGALEARETLYRLFKQRPMKDEELMVNLPLFMRSGSLAKLLFINEIYQQILNVPGGIFEFGVWMGQTTVLFENLRAVYEPYNTQRRICAFDTFTGYSGIGENDRPSDIICEGVYTVAQGYESYLRELMDYHERENVLTPSSSRHSLIKGDAAVTCKAYVEANQQTIVALAYFDMALYEPTVQCLRAILPRLVPGSVVAFDELGHPDYPGETQAFFEVFSGRAYSITRSRFLPDRCYITVGSGDAHQ